MQNAWCKNGKPSTDELKRANFTVTSALFSVVMMWSELDQNIGRKNRDEFVCSRIETFQARNLFYAELPEVTWSWLGTNNNEWVDNIEETKEAYHRCEGEGGFFTEVWAGKDTISVDHAVEITLPVHWQAFLSPSIFIHANILRILDFYPWCCR